MSAKLRALGQVIKRVQHRHHHTLDARLAPLGITLVQWDALRHIDQEPGASAHKLAQLTFQTDQAFGSLSNRLLERGLIERRTGAGRAIRHHLSPAGAGLLGEANAAVDALLHASFAALTADEVDVLQGLLARVLAAPLARG